MKAIKGGVDRVVHVNVSKRDGYTAKISATPQRFPGYAPLQPSEFDLSGDAKNCIPGTSIRDLLPETRNVSRNKAPRVAIPRQAAARSGDGKFSKGSGSY